MDRVADFPAALEEAEKLHAGGRLAEAEEAYRRLVDCDATRWRSGVATANFNLALLYRQRQRYTECLAAYERAIRLGIRDAQEVWSNMGVVYSELRQPGRAAEMYERALKEDPRYVPALFNRAGLYEEAGDRPAARRLYRQILDIEPRHWDSLSRLAYLDRLTPGDESLVGELDIAIREAGDPLSRETLLFALGKVLDDLGDYERAFACYEQANELGKLRNAPYDPLAVEQAFSRLIRTVDASWIKNAATGSTAAPVFICGMPRSGSSLVEQILSAHPSLVAGGELDCLPQLIRQRLQPYPERLKSTSRDELEALATDYLERLALFASGGQQVSDKRPDNFLHLGLIKALFPGVRIVYTRRTVRDNCLSLWFQQLGGNLNYATHLGSASHYYRQHDRLMAHWMAIFADNIFTVDYDELVRSPEPVVRRLLEFLGLPWDERCLAFHESDSLVKTASVWQVREALHQRSSGRWRNYAPYLAEFA